MTKSQISIGSSTSLALILQNKVCLVLLSNRSWKSILCMVSNYPCSFKKRKCLWQYWNVFLVFICSVVSWNLRCSAFPRKCFPADLSKKNIYSWFRLYACVDTETMIYQATPFCLPSLVLKRMLSLVGLILSSPISQQIQVKHERQNGYEEKVTKSLNFCWFLYLGFSVLNFRLRHTVLAFYPFWC